MKYWIIVLTLVYTALAPAATFSQRLAQLNNDPDVLEAIEQSAPAPVSGFADLWTATIKYASIEGDVARENLVGLVGVGGAEGSWYWVRGVPDVLSNTPTVYYDSLQAGPFTPAQIEGFCNTKWATIESNPAPIKQLSLERIDGLTTRVSGLFHVPSDSTHKWQRRSFVARFTAPNQAIGAVLFERVADN